MADLRIKPSLRKRLLAGFLITAGVGLFFIGAIAIPNGWDGLSQEIIFFISAAAIPLTILSVSRETAAHLKRAVYLALSLVAVLAVVAGVRYAWLGRSEPVVKVAVSLPFGSDEADAAPMYDAIQKALADQLGDEATRVDDHTMRVRGHLVQLMPFDDSAIGDVDCTIKHGCPVTILDHPDHPDGKVTGTKSYFSEIVDDPQVAAIIGPFNSGVAAREAKAANEAGLALLSASNTADCLTNPKYASDGCDVATIGTGTYFSLATPDSVRQKALADYLWDTWRKTHPDSEPKVVVYAESGPKAAVFSRGSANTFSEAWTQHTSVKPAVYPLANGSDVTDIKDSLSKLTFQPDIILFAGTGEVGARLYKAAAESGRGGSIFAGPGSIENRQYGDNLNVAGGGTLYAVDFAAARRSICAGMAPVSDAAAGRCALRRPEDFQDPRLYGATSYDATAILLRSLQKPLGEAIMKTLDRQIRWQQAVAPLALNFESTLRREIIHEIKWLNTDVGDSVSYQGITGTYSFDEGNVDGAAGVTISTYNAALHIWQPAP